MIQSRAISISNLHRQHRLHRLDFSDFDFDFEAPPPPPSAPARGHNMCALLSGPLFAPTIVECNTHSSHLMQPQASSYGSIPISQIPSSGMSPSLGAFMGQQFPNNMPFPRPQKVDTEFSPNGRFIISADRDFKVRVTLFPKKTLDGAHEIQSFCLAVTVDDRCLFRAVAHVACLRNEEAARDENHQRELADVLKARVVNELLTRRKETEWFIKRDFDAHVERIQ
ncbi:hypothetical protein TEA_011192 [Camellia sinensis var. sinensis]|uniref:OTU domain-containing protein n=1 Tax=Camellia sinensis var. sinensis TaxID=542762 RepID=A0A4S4E7A7_CAMSN|nr:hypothetical protein TEA_011192 [Camellia sinensis var. sinensis]